MLMIRSLLFVVWLYAAIAVIGIVCGIVALFDPRWVYVGARCWARTTMFGARWICGIRWQLEGAELLPDYPVLVASKHHSMLDVIVPFLFFDRPSFVLKQELLAMPVFGWYARRIGIAIDRDGAMSALRKMVSEAKERTALGSSIIIYPEGTRQNVGAPPDDEPGVAAIYGMIGLDCLPIAHNGGLCWPAHGLLRKPGVVTFKILPMIPKGMKRPEFMAELEARIETATGALIANPPEAAKPGSH